MAAPPTRRKLTTDDVPGAPDWLERLLVALNGVLVPVSGGLANGLTFGENFAGEVREVTLTPENDWLPLAGYTANGWTEDTSGGRAPLGCRKTADGKVYLRGAATHAPGPTPGAAVLTWPNGYAPAYTHSFGTATSTGFGGIDAAAAGLLYYTGGTVLPVDEITFDAADRTPPRWAAPVDVKLGQPQRPFPGKAGQVLVLGARQAADATLPAVVTGLDWTPLNLEKQKAAPAIRIHRVWGLAPGVKYLLTLLVLPE